MNEKTTFELLAQPDIGGASLVPEKFIKIIEAANQPNKQQTAIVQQFSLDDGRLLFHKRKISGCCFAIIFYSCSKNLSHLGNHRCYTNIEMKRDQILKQIDFEKTYRRMDY